jgi:hypothetical protein
MIDLQVTEQELNTILHGKLITKLNSLDRENTLRKEAICDI